MQKIEVNSETMHDRIKRIITDPHEREKVIFDYTHTFIRLGLNPDQAHGLCLELLHLLQLDEDLSSLETRALNLLEAKGLITVLDTALSNRAEIIFKQISSFAGQINGKILDYGTGDGQVAQLIQDRLGLQIEGVDIRDYRKVGVNIPFKLLSGSRVEVADATYVGVILTNVLHHEADNEALLKDVSRLIGQGGWVIVLETVPIGETEVEMQGDKDRTFANDYLYNRLFHNADVPVPGTFETVTGWRARFNEHGFEILSEQDLGIDQPTIRDRHYLYFLRKTP